MAQDTPTNEQSTAKLYEALGIDSSQVQVNEKATGIKEINTKADALKDASKTAIASVNSTHGKNISFVCLKRDGSLKDKNGNVVKDKDGKNTPRFVQSTMKGFWTIDKTKDGFHSVSRSHYYTETYLISDFTEMVSDA